MAFSIVLPIIASVVLGLLGLATYIALFVRGGNSTQQLRGAFFVVGFFAGCIAWGSMAFHQPISSPLGKEVVWGHRVGENISFPLIVAGIVLGIFASFGLRVALPVIAAMSMLCMTLGPFVLSGASMWIWFVFAGLGVILFSLTIFLGDRLDVVEANLRGGHESFPQFHGIVWRILVVVALVLYGLFLALSPDFGNVISTDVMVGLYGGLDLAVAIVAIVNYFLVVVVQPVYDKTNTEASRDQRVNAPLTTGRRQANGMEQYTA